jgi:hypothetical protein
MKKKLVVSHKILASSLKQLSLCGRSARLILKPLSRVLTEVSKIGGDRGKSKLVRFTKCNMNDETEGDEEGLACSMHERNYKCLQKF